MVDSALVDGVLAGDRASIGRALTLVESRYPGHRAEATALLDDLLPHAVESHRVGITGVPGVGKSTFIEALGGRLTDAGRRVAVLAVDPTSTVTGGSWHRRRVSASSEAASAAYAVQPDSQSASAGN